MSSVLPLGAKPADYFEHDRRELVARVPRPLGSVLDVGCGSGCVGRVLREEGARRLTAIELDPDAAAYAREVYDDVLVGDAEQAVAALARDGHEPFDTVLCYDILEHLYDPGAVLAALHELAHADAHLHISIPNARHVSLFLDLYGKGTFGYRNLRAPRQHIRWFTRRDTERLALESGWRPVRTETHPFRPGRALLTRLSEGALRELFAVQWFVLCKHT